MLIKYVVIFMLVLIIGSLFSALTYLIRDQGDHNDTRVLKALTIRIGLSFVLFLALGAGYYFGLIPGTGLYKP